MSDTSGNNGCGSSTGGPIPGTKKRNIIPGFNPPDTLMHQYAPAWPAGEIFTRCNVPTKTPLDASLNSNQFSLKVGSRETVRFEPDTFSVDYAILVKNPDYFGTPEQIKKWQTDNNTTSLPPKIHLTEKIPIQSRKLKHPYVIPPCLGGRALFESCRVVLDGIEIPSPRLNDVGILHQQISRTFAS